MATGRGDSGYTDMSMGGRMAKDDPRCEAVGRLDSFHASLGMSHHFLSSSDKVDIKKIQHTLFKLMGEIPCAEDNKVKYFDKYGGVTQNDVDTLEEYRLNIAMELDKKYGGQSDWTLYGEDGFNSSILTKASTDLRAAERSIVELRNLGYVIRDEILAFINRLDKTLYALSKKYKEES